MKKSNIIIIDDESSARSTLNLIISNHLPDYSVIGEAESVKEGLQLIKALGSSIDILLLDIELTDGTGFELLEKVDNVDFEVIFTTAYDNYAIKAFEFSAVGYILKPINIEELESTLNRIAERTIGSRSNTEIQLKTLLEYQRTKEISFKKLVVPTVDGFEIIDLDYLIRCEGERNYTKFYLTDNRSFLSSKTLKKYEELLSEKGFLRIHKSHLINLSHVKKYLKSDGGSIMLSDGSEILISRDKKEIFLRQFNG
ncbi:MAG: response regulator transcription factor [Crocinitomicaceae bacterium]|nr:response regulator transcription factor [Crocinitomicaceae bacterium]